MLPPVRDHNPNFDTIPEPFHSQAFIMELAVEAFHCLFCHGLPGSINAHSISCSVADLSSAL